MTAVGSQFPKFKSLSVRYVTDSIVEVTWSRPKEKNTMNKELGDNIIIRIHLYILDLLSFKYHHNCTANSFFEEFPKCFDIISQSKDILVVILTAQGKYFTAGLDCMFSSPFGFNFFMFFSISLHKCLPCFYICICV